MPKLSSGLKPSTTFVSGGPNDKIGPGTPGMVGGPVPHVGGGRGFVQSSGKRNCSCPELFGNVVAGGGGGGALPNKPKISSML